MERVEVEVDEARKREAEERREMLRKGRRRDFAV